MKKVSKKHRQSGRKKGAPPRWLVLSALAASTALHMAPRAWAEQKPAERVLPARRIDLSSLLEATWRERSVPGERTGAAGDWEATRGQDSSALQLDIPPGPLGPALEAFGKLADLDVKVTEEAIREIASPGVSGLYTAHQALERLLAGTGVTFRFTGAREVTLAL